MTTLASFMYAEDGGIDMAWFLSSRDTVALVVLVVVMVIDYDGNGPVLSTPIFTSRLWLFGNDPEDGLDGALFVISGNSGIGDDSNGVADADVVIALLFW